MGDAEKKLSRRSLLRGAFVGGSGLLTAYVVGCGGGDDGDGAQESASPTEAEGSGTASATPEATAASLVGWQKVVASGSPPRERRDHSLVTDGNTLFLFGGRSGDEALGDLWAYDLASGSWRELPEGGRPPARFGHNAAYDQARSRMLTSLDTITVDPDGDGAVVGYDAQLTLNGVLSVADPLVGGAFARVAERAADGLIQALNGTRLEDVVV